MDRSALDILLIARRLFSIANQQSQTDERLSCSAGLIILQDALELVFIACLTEKKLEKPKTFDEIIEKIEKNGDPILNKTKLQGINKIRVPVKHYGNTIDKYVLKEALNYSMETVDDLVIRIFGKPYNQIYSTELIQHPESNFHLEEAARLMEMQPFSPDACLLSIRKAIFINFEEKYSVEEWSQFKNGRKLSLTEQLTFKKSAPYHTRNKEWIKENVFNVFDYIQFDYAELKSQLNEYGIVSAIFFNLLQLTPRVFRCKGKSEWKHETDFAFLNTTKEIASYCLSTAVEMLLLKENHNALHRSAPKKVIFNFQTTQNSILYKSASTNSEQVQQINRGEIFSIRKIVPSFDGDSHFFEIYEFREPTDEWLIGYIPEAHMEQFQTAQTQLLELPEISDSKTVQQDAI